MRVVVVPVLSDNYSLCSQGIIHQKLPELADGLRELSNLMCVVPVFLDIQKMPEKLCFFLLLLCQKRCWDTCWSMMRKRSQHVWTQRRWTCFGVKFQASYAMQPAAVWRPTLSLAKAKEEKVEIVAVSSWGFEGKELPQFKTTGLWCHFSSLTSCFLNRFSEVLTTHHHMDHAGGNAEMVKQVGDQPANPPTNGPQRAPQTPPRCRVWRSTEVELTKWRPAPILWSGGGVFDWNLQGDRLQIPSPNFQWKKQMDCCL